jgi:hypothetical protein
VLARRFASSGEVLSGETSSDNVIEEEGVIDNIQPELIGEEGGETPRSYRQFMDTIGYQYRFATPRNWLGRNGPFPMNPSFRPPPPISDYQREIMWKLFSKDGQKFSVRRLAKRFNLSIKRVDAILRLKGMEQDWIKQGKQLQTGFLQGMERLLDAQTHNAITRMIDVLVDTKNTAELDVLPERMDVHKADMLEQEERRDATSYRYERLYWESVPEDADEPVLPNILQHVKKRAEVKRILEERRKKERFTKSVPNTRFIRRPKNDVLVKYRKYRPATKFVDVGAEFINVKELTKRTLTAARKARLRGRRAAQKTAALHSRRTT